MKNILSFSIVLFLIFSAQSTKAQSFPDSISVSKKINAFLVEYGKATTKVDTLWLKSNLLDSFQYSDPLSYNLGKSDYISLYAKGTYKISKANATIQKIIKKGNSYEVSVQSDIEGDAGGQAVSGTYPFLFRLVPQKMEFKIRSLEVTQ